MSNKSTFLIMLMLVLATGCVSLKEHNLQERETITTDNVNKLSGRYKLSSENKSTIDLNHGNLFYNFSLIYRVINEDSLEQYTVQLNVLNSEKIRFELYKGDNLIAKTIRRGCIKDNYFYCRNQLFVLPFIPVLYGYRTQRQRIGLHADTLIVDIREKSLFGFLIAGRLGKSKESYYYKRVE